MQTEGLELLFRGHALFAVLRLCNAKQLSHASHSLLQGMLWGLVTLLLSYGDCCTVHALLVRWTHMSHVRIVCRHWWRSAIRPFKPWSRRQPRPLNMDTTIRRVSCVPFTSWTSRTRTCKRLTSQRRQSSQQTAVSTSKQAWRLWMARAAVLRTEMCDRCSGSKTCSGFKAYVHFGVYGLVGLLTGAKDMLTAAYLQRAALYCCFTGLWSDPEMYSALSSDESCSTT